MQIGISTYLISLLETRRVQHSIEAFSLPIYLRALEHTRLRALHYRIYRFAFVFLASHSSHWICETRR
jgi:hypothetical protein